MKSKKGLIKAQALSGPEGGSARSAATRSERLGPAATQAPLEPPLASNRFNQRFFKAFSKGWLRLRKIGVCVLGFCLFSLAPGASANPFEETVRILEDWTSFHWGRDCLVWIVHYPEELIDPWVDSEAARTGMTESERSTYREAFAKELRSDSSEAFLFTVYAFGPRPLSFSPISEKVALVTASGERVKPTRYDGALDQPLTGTTQGLIFFPKQRERDFAVSVKGMGVHDERVFAFNPSFSGGDLLASSPKVKEEEVPVVVVELPASPNSKKGQKTSAAKTPDRTARKKTDPAGVTVIENPNVPVSPAAPQRPAVAPPQRPDPEIVIIEPDEKGDVTDFDRSLAEAPQEDAKASSEETPPEADTDNAYVSRERTLRNFLDLWTKNDPGKMYDMLSAASQKRFSRETFASELRKASDFRSAIRDGYKIDWVGEERAKIVAVRRMLVIRTLVSRTLGVTREDSVWKIVW